MNTSELRQKYLDFFKSKGHSIISSASLLPENDPTVLFTTAGMHPLVPYLMGEKHPEGKRLTSVQKCIRTGDIDEVGDNSHLTFFEMLGNWSLGDYFKKEAIEWSYEFLTSGEYLGIDPKKLAVTIFEGDDDAPLDTEAKQAWLDLGISEERISTLPKKDNWWGPAGQTGPCGPDSEMFYWVGESEFPPAGSNVKTDEENWLEIWNDVFMQYTKNADGTFSLSEQQNVDTGMGVERVVAVLNGYKEVYRVDTLWPIVEVVEAVSGKTYDAEKQSMRVIVDHLRAATMIMGDTLGVAPSNMDQGYVVRKLIRRSIRHGKKLGIETNFCVDIAKKSIEVLGSVYTELEKNKEFVLREIEKEEEQFRKTLESGIKEFEKLLKGFQMAFEKTNRKITEVSGKQAFKLYDTYGFPYEMTEELAHEHDLTVDKAGFDAAFEKHQELSRKGAEQKFKGGMADTGEMSVKYHTATHLLHVALKRVLGDHVAQKGSNITADRLRFDFTHGEKMTPEQKQKVEQLVNAAIEKDYPISFTEMTVEEATAQGAIGLFGDKYGEKVKVYTVGNPAGKAEGNPESDTFSKEICGGPHVEHTGVLGKFRIKKEESSSAGVRRIKGLLE
jgi:alanyl-tRNA synthetase